MRELKPVLKDDALYAGDNGRITHGRCSGASARFGGRDISGQQVAKISDVARREWVRLTGHEMVCESCGAR